MKIIDIVLLAFIVVNGTLAAIISWRTNHKD